MWVNYLIGFGGVALFGVIAMIVHWRLGRRVEEMDRAARRDG